jgi:hypothetical protein
MTKDQFKKAFRRGLGSAIVELKTCTCREKYTDIVLWCCLHNTCYDAQCEGGRGVYDIPFAFPYSVDKGL